MEGLCESQAHLWQEGLHVSYFAIVETHLADDQVRYRHAEAFDRDSELQMSDLYSGSDLQPDSRQRAG